MSTLLKRYIPSWSRWRALPNILSHKDKMVLFGLVAVFIFSSVGLLVGYYIGNSVAVPDYGGQYREALIGSPQYINPILAENNEVDRDLSVLLFSGLMKYDDKGLLKADIAERYEILDSGRTYIFYMRKDAFWHDGERLTTDDVVFTVGAFQDPGYRSPLSLNWRGVKVEKIDDFTVKFSLNNVFAPFLENLTVGILPKHIWESISPSTFQISDYNLNPIGSGPYRFSKIEKNSEKTNIINQITLKSNESYYLGRPYIDTIILKFYKSEDDAIKAFNGGDVDGISYLSPQNRNKISSVRKVEVRQLKIPRYFAVFLNQLNSKALTDVHVRKALAYATNKVQIINQALLGQADIIDAPILKDILGIDNFTEIYSFSLENSRKELTGSGWSDTNNDGILDKKIIKTDKEPAKLEINLYTSDWVELTKIADILKQQWEAIGGVKVNINVQNINDLSQKVIRPRQFDALLFGEILYMDPDPFSFWHSSQKKDPGLNLSAYDNTDVDKLLEQARQTLDYGERIRKYDAFQQIITQDVPAIFLFSPHYLYMMLDSVKGVDIKNIATPARRFSGIEKWHMRTKREFRD